jgi:hypothetical protein
VHDEVGEEGKAEGEEEIRGEERLDDGVAIAAPSGDGADDKAEHQQRERIIRQHEHDDGADHLIVLVVTALHCDGRRRACEANRPGRVHCPLADQADDERADLR